MAVKIRLKRMGKIRAPFYRVVIMDSRTKRDGRAIEEIGKYHPTEEPSVIQIDSDRAQYWLTNGAQPTEAVAALLKITGDWQKFKGEPGAEGTLRVAAPKPSKKDLYEKALAAAGSSGSDSSSAPRKKAAAKVDEPKAEQPKADAPKAEQPKADAPKAAEPKAEAPAAATAEEPEAVAADLPEGAAAPTEDGSAPEGFAIKGNRDSMKFHEPDGQWYEQTVAEVWFATAEAAEAAGFAKAGA